MGTPSGGPLRIGLIGGECTGKSSLAEALAAALPACRVDEVLRETTDREGRPPRQDQQAGILAQQQAREDATARECPHAWLVADPAALMTAVYSRVYFDDDSLTAAASDLASGYSLVVWCADDLPWTADGAHRDGPDARSRADTVIAAVVREHLEPRGIRVLRVNGPLEERVARVRRACQPGRPGAPT